MSIILDALRKAEASRGESDRLGLTTPARARLRTRTQLPRWALPVAAVALLGCGLAGYLLLSRETPQEKAVTQREPARLRAPPASSSATTAPTPVPPPAAAPAPAAAGSTPHTAPASSGHVRVLALEARLATPPRAAPPARAHGSVEVRDLVGGGEAQAPAGKAIKPGTVEVRDLLAEEGLAEPVPEAGPGPTVGSASAERQALANKEEGLLARAPAGAARPAPRPATPSLDELVADGQLNPPDIGLDMHAYADDPAARFVYINMRRYRIGDTTREGAIVQEITPDGVVLQLQGRRFFMSAR